MDLHPFLSSLFFFDEEKRNEGKSLDRIITKRNFMSWLVFNDILLIITSWHYRYSYSLDALPVFPPSDNFSCTWLTITRYKRLNGEVQTAETGRGEETKDTVRSHIVASEEGLYNHVLLVLEVTSQAIEAWTIKPFSLMPSSFSPPISS